MTELLLKIAILLLVVLGHKIGELSKQKSFALSFIIEIAFYTSALCIVDHFWTFNL